MSNTRRAALSIFVAGVLFSTGGAGVKFCPSFDAWQIAGIRSGLAALVIIACSRTRSRRISPRVLVVAACFAATLTLYAAANKYTTAANAIFLQSSAPLYILVASPLLLGEAPRARDIVTAIAIAIGVTAIFFGDDAPRDTAPDPGFGDVLGAASGVTWAAAILGMRALARGPVDRGASAIIAANVLTLLIALPFAWPLPDAAPTEWIALLYLGCAQVGLAYVLVTRAMPALSAVQASLILMIEPALNPVIAWLTHGEQPSGPAIVGGMVIVVALIVGSATRPSSSPRLER